jgi:hypothetical protein
MNFLKKILAPTPRQHRINGQISTAISGACTAVLSLGHIKTEEFIIALTFCAVLFGGKAVFHAQKTLK